MDGEERLRLAFENANRKIKRKKYYHFIFLRQHHILTVPLQDFAEDDQGLQTSKTHMVT